jgi:hypothetical protein
MSGSTDILDEVKEKGFDTISDGELGELIDQTPEEIKKLVPEHISNAISHYTDSKNWYESFYDDLEEKIGEIFKRVEEFYDKDEQKEHIIHDIALYVQSHQEMTDYLPGYQDAILYEIRNPRDFSELSDESLQGEEQYIDKLFGILFKDEKSLSPEAEKTLKRKVEFVKHNTSDLSDPYSQGFFDAQKKMIFSLRFRLKNPEKFFDLSKYRK